MKATTNHNPPRSTTFRPKALSPAQENAIELFLAGKGDTEVARILGIARETAWSWRREHPVFMATLQRRRAEVWGTAGERLRSLMAKAVDNIAGLVEVGDYDASVELLKITGLYRGVVNGIGEQDPEKIIKSQAEAQVRREGIPQDELETLGRLHDNPRYHRRVAEVEAELRAAYGDAQA
jgi:hypothetical protein